MPYLILCLMLFFTTGCAPKTTLLPTVKEVDLQRYSGTWYEIARYENRFEEGCIGASATYTPKADYIEVLNRCMDIHGSVTVEAYGKAYSVEGSNNAKLRVTFFWPFYGDYWVMMLGRDYGYSVVGDPQRKYLWILSRTPHLPTEIKSDIFATLPAMGYNPNKLVWNRYESQ